MKPIIDKAEFRFTDGTSVVWSKDERRWHIVLFKHGCNSKDVWSAGYLPTIANALYFVRKYPLTKN